MISIWTEPPNSLDRSGGLRVFESYLVRRGLNEFAPPRLSQLPWVLRMTVRLTLALLFLACSSGFGLAACITNIGIIEAVNAKLPPAEQFGDLGWYPMKTLRLHREYRRLYPGGTLLRREGILACGALGSLVVTATLLGFGVLGIVFVGGGGALSLWFLYFRDRPLSD